MNTKMRFYISFLSYMLNAMIQNFAYSLQLAKGIAMYISNKLLANLSVKDKEFLARIYADGIEKYEYRIQAIDFVGKQNVLDAGCGFGQWSIALAKYNRQIESIEIAQERVDFCKQLFIDQKIHNISVQQGSIEKLPYKDNQFELVFCYGVMLMTNWRDSLKEFFRVLAPNGILYVCTNDIGWYYHMIIDEPNKTIGYDPRTNAIQAFINEWRYANNGESCFIGERVMRAESVKKELENYNCKLLQLMGEGQCIINQSFKDKIKPFFKDTYHSCRGVYEFIARKESA